jgi:type IX secretion system PorP/SprF family membrane protein
MDIHNSVNIISQEMKKSYILLILLILVSSKIVPQQESLISQYRQQMSLFNPAAVSVDVASKISIIHRRQWMNVPSSPVTTSLTYGFYAGKNVGLGLSVITDKVFIASSTFVGIDYSYKLKINEDSDLYLGIKAGGSFFSLNTSNLNTYNFFSDPSLNSISSFLPNIGFGAYYKRGDFYISMGAPRMLSTKRAKENNGIVSAAGDRMHFYSSIGYLFLINEFNNIKLKPSIFSRNVIGAPSSIDFNTMVSFNNKFELGATYRTGISYAVIAQLAINKNLSMGWTYEIFSKPELTNTGDSHEFMLAYKF